ncbi:MAG: hypothetical protein ABI380_07125 [Edaphobacter sp.]
MKSFALFAAVLALVPSLLSRPPAQGHSVQVSLVESGHSGAAISHGWHKVKAALTSKGVSYEVVATPEAVHGVQLLVAGLPSTIDIFRSIKVPIPAASEFLAIRGAEWQDRRAVFVGGSDDRGLMYALLEVADRIGWANGNTAPLSEVRDRTESPSVADRGVTIFTMQQRQFEDRLHDENYCAKYFDTPREGPLQHRATPLRL